MIGTQHRVFAYRFRDKNRKAVPYWRDVGTLDAYYQANMDLIEVDPVLNLYDARLADPHVSSRNCRRRSSLFAAEGAGRHGPPRRGPRQHGLPRAASSPAATSAAVDPVAERAGQQLRAWSRNRSCSTAWTSAATAGSRRAIIDKDVKVPPHTTVGYDAEHDRQRGFTVTERRHRGHRQGHAAGSVHAAEALSGVRYRRRGKAMIGEGPPDNSEQRTPDAGHRTVISLVLRRPGGPRGGGDRRSTGRTTPASN